MNEGKKAPAFSTLASNGHKVSLKDFLGKNIVLYFYPKDDTPGCTIEACNFRDNIKSIEKNNAVVLGVSPDSVMRHEKFISKYDLPFVLLADEDHSICEKYGVWVEKNMYGRKYMGVARTTFLIDRAGRVAKRFDKVKPKEHAQEIIEALSEKM